MTRYIIPINQNINDANDCQPPSFDAVIKEMEDWRSQRPKHSKTPIPDRLWLNIFSLAKLYKPSRVRQALGLSSAQYQKKFAQLHALDSEPQSQDAPSLEFCEVGTHCADTQPKPEPKPSPESEISEIPATNTMLVEFRRKKDDEVMIIHATTNHLQDMIRAFFNGEL